jgi:SAM-dependent methyltransferase
VNIPPEPAAPIEPAAGTDIEWQKWGEQDPYFAVITEPKFRSANLTAEAKQQFFDSGQRHVQYVLECCRPHFDPTVPIRRVLDFGCGTGRLVLPFARQFEHVVGVDISPAMLNEARRNATDAGLSNISWSLSDDALSAVQGRFELVHTFITLQHLETPRARTLFLRLIDLVNEGGVAALHITYSNSGLAPTYGVLPPNLRIIPPPPSKAGEDPVMLMTLNSLSELAFIMQSKGIRRFSAEFTDHGGALGVFLFFGKPKAAP